MLTGDKRRFVEEDRGQLDDAIALGEMTAKVTENRSTLGGRKVATALAAGYRGSDLNGGNVGDINPMTGLGSEQR